MGEGGSVLHHWIASSCPALSTLIAKVTVFSVLYTCLLLKISGYQYVLDSYSIPLSLYVFFGANTPVWFLKFILLRNIVLYHVVFILLYTLVIPFHMYFPYSFLTVSLDVIYSFLCCFIGYVLYHSIQNGLLLLKLNHFTPSPSLLSTSSLFSLLWDSSYCADEFICVIFEIPRVSDIICYFSVFLFSFSLVSHNPSIHIAPHKIAPSSFCCS